MAAGSVLVVRLADGPVGDQLVSYRVAGRLVSGEQAEWLFGRVVVDAARLAALRSV